MTRTTGTSSPNLSPLRLCLFLTCLLLCILSFLGFLFSSASTDRILSTFLPIILQILPCLSFLAVVSAHLLDHDPPLLVFVLILLGSCTTLELACIV